MSSEFEPVSKEVKGKRICFSALSGEEVESLPPEVLQEAYLRAQENPPHPATIDLKIDRGPTKRIGVWSFDF